MSRLMSLFTVGSFALLVFISGQDHAMSITFYNNAPIPSGERFTLEATGSFEAFFADPNTYSTTIGDVFTVHPPNLTNELAAINARTNPSQTFLLTDFTKTDPAPVTFTSMAEYILLKIGGGNSNNTALVKNLTPNNMLTFTPRSGAGAGISHYSEAGELEAVAVPSTIDLLSTLAATLCCGTLLKRRRRAN